jgi:hypothetical protein
MMTEENWATMERRGGTTTHRVLEVDRTALRVGKATIVHDTEEELVELASGLFDFLRRRARERGQYQFNKSGKGVWESGSGRRGQKDVRVR